MADDDIEIQATGEVIDWHGQASNVEAWFYSSKAWVTAAGTPQNHTSPTDVYTFNKPYKKAVCTVNVTTHKLGVAALPISATEDASVNPDVTIVGVFVDVSKATPTVIMPFSVLGEYAFTISPDEPTPTWEEIAVHSAGGLASLLERDVRVNGDADIQGYLNVEHTVTAAGGFIGITNTNVPTALSNKNISDSALTNSDINNPTVDGGTFEGPTLHSPIIENPTFAADTPFTTGPITASGPIIAPSIQADLSACTGLPGTPSGPAFESLESDAAGHIRYQADDGGIGEFNVFRGSGADSVLRGDLLGRFDFKGGLVQYTKGALPAAGKPGRRAIVTDDIGGEFVDNGLIWIKEYGGVVNVATRFGVVADGVTDDSAALQDAADVAPGMRLYFPSLADITIYMFGALEIPAGVKIIRDPGVILKLKPESDDVVNPLFDVRGIDVLFIDLEMDGNRDNQSGAAQVDSFDNGATGGRAWRSLILARGDVYTISGLRIEHCKLSNCVGAAVATRDVDDLEIKHNKARDLNYEAFYCAAGRSARIEHNNIEGIGWGGVGHVTSGATGNAILIADYDDFNVEDNFIRSVDRDGVKVELGGVHGAVKNNKIYQSGMVAEGYGTTYPAIALVSNDPLEHVQVSDNIIDDCGQGINVQVGSGGVYDLLVNDNQINNVRGFETPDGLALVFNDETYTATKVKFEGNKVYNFNRYGLNLHGGDNVTAFNNELIADGVTEGTRGIQVTPVKAIANLTLEMNDIEGCTNTGGPGINLFGDLGAGLTYSNLRVLRNFVDAGSDVLAGFRASLDNMAAFSQDFILSGRFDGNYIRGKYQTTAPALLFTNNYVSGEKTADGASTELSLVNAPTVLGASATADFFGATVAHSKEDSATTIPVNGAVPGDMTLVGGPEGLMGEAGALITARVSANNVVKVSRTNLTASALTNPGSVTLNVRVLKL